MSEVCHAYGSPGIVKCRQTQLLRDPRFGSLGVVSAQPERRLGVRNVDLHFAEF
jgi:hypothetical protein